MAKPIADVERHYGMPWPNWPLPIWMILVSLSMGILSGRTPGEVIKIFNDGWGYAVGEFALILIPSFILAAVIEQRKIEVSQLLSVGLAPVAGAGMVCPDTAYAALSPMTRRKRISLAFGAYSGFKLLFPAGPLIVATSLGVADGRLLLYCALIFLPVWAVGLIYGRVIDTRYLRDRLSDSQVAALTGSMTILWPFTVLATLLVLGMTTDIHANPWLSFATNPKGALLITAALALGMVEAEDRRSCLDIALRRTASLLLIIGAASAFGAFLTLVSPIEQIFTAKQGGLTLVVLFLLSAAFKIVQGSSMAVFAAVGPIALPIVAASEVSPLLAVIAICLGSFVAILPNDSFYWLIRKSALAGESEWRSTIILTTGSTLQAIVGFAILMGVYFLQSQ